MRVIPFRRMELAYALIAPRGFDAVTDLDERPLAPLERLPIGRFVEGGADGARIDIEVYGSARELALPDLLAHDCDRDGLVLERAEPNAYGPHEAIDALARRPAAAAGPGPGADAAAGAGARRLHIILLRQGGRFLRLTASASAAAFDGVAERFAVALSSFRLKTPGTDALIEPFSYLGSTGALPLGLRIGDAWRSREVPDLPHGRQALEAALVDKADVLAALRAEAFDSEAFGPPSLDRLAQEALAGIARLGFQPTRLAQRYRAALPGRAALAYERGEVHEGRALGKACEARLALRLGRPAHHAVSVIGPRQADDPFGWMVARRALEIAVMSLGDPSATFAVSPEAMRVLRAGRDVTPVYSADGSLDDRSFDGFDLADDADDPGDRLEDRQQVVARDAFEDELRRRASR